MPHLSRVIAPIPTLLEVLKRPIPLIAAEAVSVIGIDPDIALIKKLLIAATQTVSLTKFTFTVPCVESEALELFDEAFLARLDVSCTLSRVISLTVKCPPSGYFSPAFLACFDQWLDTMPSLKYLSLFEGAAPAGRFAYGCQIKAAHSLRSVHLHTMAQTWNL